MLVLMKAGASEADIEAVCDHIRGLGFTPHKIPGAMRVAIGVTGNQGAIDPTLFQHFTSVAEAVPVSKPWKLVSREVKPESTVVKIVVKGGRTTECGGGAFTVMAGPCAVENRDQLMAAARAVHQAGATMLRGGAFKPRTSPYAFQGMKEDGLKLLAEARAETGLPVITEVVDTRDVEVVARYADVLQVGARNMQNFALLEAVGLAGKPVMLKRGMSATIQEWLYAAEYIVSKGNYDVILCERGIRTFETMTRNTLDLGSLPLLKRLTHLPLVVDPSHGTGDYRSVPALARAAVAIGADGLMVEVHPDPARALSDGPQSLTPANFAKLMTSVKAIAEVVGLRL
jgi:3-deoxy-7-phosphoheptulonate synthase